MPLLLLPLILLLAGVPLVAVVQLTLIGLTLGLILALFLAPDASGGP